ncbi:hypothetical protein F66182_8388 [Fusarium sp. NRRL 66182]|nr:hypothetical protein F66182_8388 [Fusarium sp. NRRL 66182]
MTSKSPKQSRGASSGIYDTPADYSGLGEVVQQPIQQAVPSDTDAKSTSAPAQRDRHDSGAYSVPRSYNNLDEVSSIHPIEEPPLDTAQDQPAGFSSFARHGTPIEDLEPMPEETGQRSISKLATELYTHSYLVLFAILGTLARIGLTALTRYSGTPVIFNTVWANFTGSLVMGFLAEDRNLFRREWGHATYDKVIKRAKQRKDDGDGSGSSHQKEVDLEAAKRAHLAAKKTIPLYIGLATGFCGSFTTFSSFIRDVFLALSNELSTPGWAESPTSRNGGYSFMAMLAVVIATVSLSLSGLSVGAHLAIGLERVTPTISFSLSRRVLDPLGVLLGWGCWFAAVLLAIFPPRKTWRGQAIFALVFAPLGCLLRFHLSLHLNGKKAAFPLGTLSANILGTVLLGMSWDLAHVPLGGVVGCQVLQGIEDGFCGSLTTISTWVAELGSLRRRSAWMYGTTSVVVSLALMIAIMGGLRWSDGYNKLLCAYCSQECLETEKLAHAFWCSKRLPDTAPEPDEKQPREHFWAQQGAIDFLRSNSNGCSESGEQLRILLTGRSLRHVLYSIANLPTTANPRISWILNERNVQEAALVMTCLGLLANPDTTNDRYNAQAVAHLLYSAELPPKVMSHVEKFALGHVRYSVEYALAAYRLRQIQPGKTMCTRAKQDFGTGRSNISIDLKYEQWIRLKQWLNLTDRIAKGEVASCWSNDLINTEPTEHAASRMTKTHASAFMKWRQEGILLPYSRFSDESIGDEPAGEKFTHLNPFFYMNATKCFPGVTGDPLTEWPPEALENNDYSARNDLYGLMFEYVQRLCIGFRSRISTLYMGFSIISSDTPELLRLFHEQGVKFDKIEGGLGLDNSPADEPSNTRSKDLAEDAPKKKKRKKAKKKQKSASQQLSDGVPAAGEITDPQEEESDQVIPSNTCKDAATTPSGSEPQQPEPEKLEPDQSKEEKPKPGQGLKDEVKDGEPKDEGSTDARLGYELKKEPRHELDRMCFRNIERLKAGIKSINEKMRRFKVGSQGQVGKPLKGVERPNPPNQETWPKDDKIKNSQGQVRKPPKEVERPKPPNQKLWSKVHEIRNSQGQVRNPPKEVERPKPPTQKLWSKVHEIRNSPGQILTPPKEVKRRKPLDPKIWPKIHEIRHSQGQVGNPSKEAERRKPLNPKIWPKIHEIRELKKEIEDLKNTTKEIIKSQEKTKKDFEEVITTLIGRIAELEKKHTQESTKDVKKTKS